MEHAEVFDENGDWTLKSKHLERWRPTPFLNTYLAGPKPPRASSTLQYTLFNRSYLLYVKVRPIGSHAPYRYPIAPYRYPRDPSGQAAYSVLPLGSLDLHGRLEGTRVGYEKRPTRRASTLCEVGSDGVGWGTRYMKLRSE